MLARTMLDRVPLVGISRQPAQMSDEPVHIPFLRKQSCDPVLNNLWNIAVTGTYDGHSGRRHLDDRDRRPAFGIPGLSRYAGSKIDVISIRFLHQRAMRLQSAHPHAVAEPRLRDRIKDFLLFLQLTVAYDRYFKFE